MVSHLSAVACLHQLPSFLLASWFRPVNITDFLPSFEPVSFCLPSHASFLAFMPHFSESLLCSACIAKAPHFRKGLKPLYPKLPKVLNVNCSSSFLVLTMHFLQYLEILEPPLLGFSDSILPGLPFGSY